MIKISNDITVKIKCTAEELHNSLKSKGFNVINEFCLNDTYFIPRKIKLSNTDVRNILKKAVIVRKMSSKISNKVIKKITFKVKRIDESGNILGQHITNCQVNDIEEAKDLLHVIGYKEIMSIEEDNTVYQKGDIQLSVKEIKNSDTLIEMEIEKNKERNIKELIKKINEIGIPIDTDSYFVKKAEIELYKILEANNIEKSCGCIIIDDNKVLLVQDISGHWGFPKGHVEKNETEQETAIRETKEETNLEVKIINNKRYIEKYITDKQKNKQVTLFLAKKISGDIKPQQEEIKEIKWLEFSQALETITYKNSKDILKQVLKDIDMKKEC